MSAPLKTDTHALKKVGAAKPSRIIKMGDEVINKIKISQAKKQAKNIIKGLEEAEQIRLGKLKTTTFEEYFGTI